jgi:hypothetical protein
VALFKRYSSQVVLLGKNYRYNSGDFRWAKLTNFASNYQSERAVTGANSSGIRRRRIDLMLNLKNLALAGASIALVASLAACGGSTESTSTTTTTGAGTGTDAAATSATTATTTDTTTTTATGTGAAPGTDAAATGTTTTTTTSTESH